MPAWLASLVTIISKVLMDYTVGALKNWYKLYQEKQRKKKRAKANQAKAEAAEKASTKDEVKDTFDSLP